MLKSIVEFALLGLGTGAIYVLAAQGLVLVYRGSGVVNFANGAFAVIGAYAFTEFEESGLPEVPALILALLLSAAVGAATNLIIMRRLKNAAQLTSLIATLGLLQLITGAYTIHYQNNEASPSFPLPNPTVHIFGTPIGGYYVIMFGLAIVLSAGLWAFYRYSAFGLRTTASAENMRALAALGHSPDRVATWNWATGALLAGAGGILVAPVIGLSVGSMALLLVPTMASALLGGFTSFSLTLLGGLVIGVGEAEVQRATSQIGWPEVVPLIIVIVILVLRGSSLPTRGFVSLRLPKVGSGQIPWRRVVPALVIGVVVCLVVSGGAAGALTGSLTAAIILLSLVVVTGYAGQLSLAQLGMAGIGAFIAARLGMAFGLNFWEALVIAVFAVIPIGILLGLPALRTRGVNLAIVTLAFGVIVSDVILANPAYTGGAAGTVVQTPTFFGLNLDAEVYPQRYAILCLVFFVLCALAVLNLRRGRVGRQLIAVRGNERAAATLGISVFRTKLYAFALAGSIATIGGVLIIYQAPAVTWTMGWDVVTGITLLSAVVIGGIGYVGGSILGGIGATTGLIAYLFYFAGMGVQDWIPPIAGGGLILALMHSNDGVLAMKERRTLAKKERKRRAAGVSKESEEAEALEVFERKVRSLQTAARSADRQAHELKIENLSVHFGGVVALDDVSFSVHSGEVVGLIGPNGAGKTTLIDAVTGITRRYSGHISLDGRNLDTFGATQRARLGLSRSFQALELFDDLTVEENVRVGDERPKIASYVSDLVWPVRHELSPSCVTAIKEFGLAGDLAKHPSELSFGRRRLVGIVRAIASGPKIVLLDEPGAGLDQRESREMVDLLRNLATRWNVGVLLVEHDMQMVMRACDRITVLDFGRVIASGKPSEVQVDPAVVAAYLGVAETVEAEPSVVGDGVAAVEVPGPAK